jgi:hypothetical protein
MRFMRDALIFIMVGLLSSQIIFAALPYQLSNVPILFRAYLFHSLNNLFVLRFLNPNRLLHVKIYNYRS